MDNNVDAVNLSGKTAENSGEAAQTNRSVGRMKFREKQFKVRNSLLTTYFETSNEANELPVAPIRNVFVAGFTLLCLYAVVRDIVSGFRHQRFLTAVSTYCSPIHHFWLILWNFEQLPQTMLCWMLMAISSLLPYVVLKQWSKVPAVKVDWLTSAALIILYIIYLFLLFCIPLMFLFWMDLRTACSFIITCENTRIAMKVHSFIRENVPRVLRIKKALTEKVESKDEKIMAFPDITRFFYFFFCPTFIYRDEYPRSKHRCMRRVYKCFGQAVLMIYFTNLVCTQIIQSSFVPINYGKITFGEIIVCIFPAIIPAMLCLMLLFYGLLHCWLNAFAELLRFGDREFYLDWWNSKSMAEYYRKWNLVVHEWLYAYIYRDIALLIGSKNDTKLSQMMVFFLSSAFHEYWFGVALRMFYPVMFTLYFVFGGIFFAISRFVRSGYLWNTLMWGNLLIGTGMFVAFYTQEWYSRHRCPSSFDSTVLDFFIPRHWMCNNDEYFSNSKSTA
uniref:O-acyltransferase n=1 Tax=Syphacia muris TaxID=451379 RepID=A0A0N5AZ98_9BILA